MNIEYICTRHIVIWTYCRITPSGSSRRTVTCEKACVALIELLLYTWVHFGRLIVVFRKVLMIFTHKFRIDRCHNNQDAPVPLADLCTWRQAGVYSTWRNETIRVYWPLQISSLVSATKDWLRFAVCFVRLV